MIFTEYLNHFYDYLTIKNYAKLTIENYIYRTKKFISFIECHYPRITDINMISKDIIFDYQRYLTYLTDKRGKLLTSKTRLSRLIVVKHFFKMLYKYDHIIVNPANSIEYPRAEKVLPRNIPSEKEVFQILGTPKTCRPSGKRDKAILELLYATGIRTSELTSLIISDLDLENQTLTIRKGKGNKMRIVPIGTYATFYIEDYLKEGRKYLSKSRTRDEGFLFINNHGTQYNRKTLNTSVIKKVIQESGLNKKYTAYSFRHAVASHLIHNQVDIRYVAELLGHTSLKTTQVYCHIEISDLKQMHCKYHPRECTTTVENITGP